MPSAATVFPGKPLPLRTNELNFYVRYEWCFTNKLTITKPAKITDPQAKWHIQEVGKKSWELDALKPEVPMRIAEEAVRQFLDVDAYQPRAKWSSERLRGGRDP